MKKLVLLLVFVLLLCLCLSGCGKHDEMIEEAIEELEDHWTEIYDTSRKNTAKDRYFEIKNTRVITLQEETIGDVEYIIEFVLYTDYYGSEIPVDAAMANGDSAVAVHRDGSMRVVSDTTIIMRYASFYLMGEDATIVKSVDDYGDKYNCKKTLD